MPSPALVDILPPQQLTDLHMQMMVLFTLQCKHKELFPTLVDHFYDRELGIETDHISRLIKIVASFYIKMRLLKASKQYHQWKILLGKSQKNEADEQNHSLQWPINILKNAGTIQFVDKNKLCSKFFFLLF